MEKVNCWICNSDKITNINIVTKEKINHFLCNECFFLYNKTNLSRTKKIKYYTNTSKNQLLNRYLENEYFDTARFLHYINKILKKNCKLDQKLNHLDIGGGFGFFSKVLKQKFPKIKSFNLEPDKSAATIAKKLNKKVNTINLPFEKIKLVKNIKFDLVTYWGGIYRTIEPKKVFEDLKKKCNENCDFFFSFPFSFDDMRMQHLELKNSFDSYLLSGDGLQGLFGKNHMRIFLKKNNFSFKEIIIQNKPFEKKIPIFIFKLKDNLKKNNTKKYNLSKYFKKNISVYNQYFIDQVKSIIKSQKKINKIYIFGEKFLSNYILSCLKSSYYKVIFIDNNPRYLYNDLSQLNNTLNLNNSFSNIFFILENKSNYKIKRSLVNRLHLNKNNNLFKLKDSFSEKKDICIFEKETYLKKKVDLVKI